MPNPDEIVDDENKDDDLELELPKGRKFVYPDGDYEFVCCNVARDVSGNGNPELICDFRGPDELNNQLFKVWLVLTKDAAWKLTEYATALGIAKEGEQLKVSTFRKMAIGRRLIGTLKVEKYNGNERSVIKTVKAHAEGPGETRPEADKAPF